MNDTRTPEFWDTSNDRDRYTCTDFDEAVELFLENERVGPLPETVTVYGFAHPEFTAESLDSQLEYLIENVDCDLGDPDGDATELSEKTMALWRAFAESFAAEYKVFLLDEVTKEEVNVREWCKENRPDLLDSP